MAKRKRQKVLTGIPVSPGIIIGKALLVDHELKLIKPISLEADDIEPEVYRFRKALADTGRQIRRFRRRVLREVGEAEAQIFDSHLMILEDPTIVEGTINGIRKERKNAEFVADLFGNLLRQI